MSRNISVSDNNEGQPKGQGIAPVFIPCRNLPIEDNTPYSVREICSAGEKTSGFNTVLGAQRIGGLWRVYTKTAEARVKLLLSGMIIRGHTISPFDKNPFIVRTPDGEKEIATTKIVIGNIPISYGGEDIEKKLCQLGCVFRSKLMMERDRDERGGLTRWLTGRRFAYVDVPKQPFPQKIEIGLFNATLFHKEQKQNGENAVCNRCFQKGHRATACENEVVCRTCRKTGHKSGDPQCTLVSSSETVMSDLQTRSDQLNSDAMAPPLSRTRHQEETLPQPVPATPVTNSRRGRSVSQATIDFRQRARSCSVSKRQRSSPSSLPDGKVARTEEEKRQKSHTVNGKTTSSGEESPATHVSTGGKPQATVSTCSQIGDT